MPLRSYDITPDGRILLIQGTTADDWADIVDFVSPRRISVVQNWLAELGEKVP